MTIKLRVLLVLAIAMLGVHGAAPAFAQSDVVPKGTPAENGPQTPGNGGQTLNGSLSLTAAYDNDLSAETVTSAIYVFGPQSITNSNQLIGNGQYQWRARDVQFRADGTSLWVHDRQTGRIKGLNQTVAGTLTARLPRRMTLLVDQAMTYTGSPLYTLFPRVAATNGVESGPAAPDSGADEVHVYAYTAQATLVQALTRRSALRVSATGERGLTVRRGTTEDQSELAAYGMSTRFTRLMTRHSRASVRYMFRAGRFPEAGVPTTTAITLGRAVRVSQQTAEIGMSYDRPVSATRRMVFDAVLGGGVLSPLDSPLTGVLRLTDSYRLVGEASATYVFARTWQAGALYRRGVDYVPGLSEPVLTDGFSGRMEGHFNRRLALQATAGYASGTSALLQSGNVFDTYTSDVKLNVTLGRAVATYVQYVYYLYDFRRYGSLVPGIPPALERNGLRVGLTLSVPTLEW